MLGRSAEFDAAVRAGTGQVVTRCDILRAGVVLEQGIPVGVGGSIRADRSGFARRTCSFTVLDKSLRPTGAATDLLSPFVSEVRLWRGLRLPSGREEMLPVGTFGVTGCDWDEPFAGVAVKGADRMQRVKDSRFPFPRGLAGPSLLGQIGVLTLEAVPWAAHAPSSLIHDFEAPFIVVEKDRDDAVVKSYQSLGAETFADPWGAFVTAPVPDPNGPVAFDFSGGVVSASRSFSRDGVFNGVVASGQSVGSNAAPVSDLIVDSDDKSPTWWGLDSDPTTQRFGRIVRFFQSSLITDGQQANAVAAAILLNRSGVPRALSFTAGAVHPALEPGDVVSLTTPDGGYEQHLLESFTMPLGPGTMTADTRAATTTDGLT